MLLVLGLLFAAPAGANHVRCGDTIAQDTTLDSDLVCAGDGVTVAGDVVFDLDGHSIDVSDSGIAVIASFGNIEVRGGRIAESGTAIRSDGPDAMLVRDMLLEANRAGVDCAYTPVCKVLDSTLHHHSSIAITMHAPDLGGLGAVQGNQIFRNEKGVRFTNYNGPITGNHIEDNEGTAVDIDYASQVDVSRNVLARNAGDAVVVSYLSDATVAHNAIEDNGGNGVTIEGDLAFEGTSAWVHDNQIMRNFDDGVHVWNAEGAPGTVIARNHVEHNFDDGIDVDLGRSDPAGVDTVVRANKAYFNADLGIEAAPGTTDGGGNKARHNGNPAQCVGVVCK